jgi:hypothetical protein
MILIDTGTTRERTHVTSLAIAHIFSTQGYTVQFKASKHFENLCKVILHLLLMIVGTWVENLRKGQSVGVL